MWSFNIYFIFTTWNKCAPIRIAQEKFWTYFAGALYYSLEYFLKGKKTTSLMCVKKLLLQIVVGKDSNSIKYLLESLTCWFLNLQILSVY